jgi:Rhodopirellula transposase DDE domain
MSAPHLSCRLRWLVVHHHGQHASRHHRVAQCGLSATLTKTELVGDFKNAGREYRPKGQPEPVRVHDFLIPELERDD